MKRFFFLMLALLAVTGCKKGGEVSTAAPAVAPSVATQAAAPAAGSSDALAKIDGEPITDAEVSERVKNNLARVESQIFDIKNDGLQDLIQEKLLAKEAEKRKMSVDELLKVEVEDKVEAPSQQELESFYSIAKERFNNAPLEQVKDQLVQQIKGTKKNSLYSKFLSQLKEGTKVEILMQRPRIEVSVDDDASKGPATAPITLIEFSDFQCPFCKRARATVQQILDTYKDKVHYVFRDFPLSFHKNAQKDAESAECAGEQGKYWEYNTLLWEKQGSQEVDQLKQYAKDMGLNANKFNECLDSGKFAKEIEKDESDGAAVGVTGTPAYFINGIFISGAQPFEKFQAVIDSELELKK